MLKGYTPGDSPIFDSSFCNRDLNDWHRRLQKKRAKRLAYRKRKRERERENESKESI